MDLLPAGPCIRSPLGGLNNSFEKDFCREEDSPIPLGILFVLSVLSLFVIVVVVACWLLFSLLLVDGTREEEEEEEDGADCTFRILSPPL